MCLCCYRKRSVTNIIGAHGRGDIMIIQIVNSYRPGQLPDMVIFSGIIAGNDEHWVECIHEFDSRLIINCWRCIFFWSCIPTIKFNAQANVQMVLINTRKAPEAVIPSSAPCTGHSCVDVNQFLASDLHRGSGTRTLALNCTCRLKIRCYVIWVSWIMRHRILKNSLSTFEVT